MTTIPLIIALSLAALPGVGPPYEVRGVTGTETARRTTVDGILSTDLDGDGRDELLAGVATGILIRTWPTGAAPRYFEQCNLPPRFLDDRGRARLGAAVDRDGDGLKELVVTAWTRDGWDQRLLVYEPDGGSLALDAVLPAGPDRRPDGVWDGRYLTLGVLERGGRPMVILSRMVDYDRVGRAVAAYDLREGTLVWSHALTGNVLDGAVADLDGDGVREIVAGVGSGANLKRGEEVAGRLDDAGWVVALDADGRVRWERRIADRFATPQPKVLDLDGDGAAEVVVATNCAAPGFVNRILVLDGGNGDVRGQSEGARTSGGIAAWYDAADGVGHVLGFTDTSRLEHFVWDGERLRPAPGAPLPAPPLAAVSADFLPEPGPEFLVRLADRQMLLLGSGLASLADLPRARDGNLNLGIWDLGDSSVVVYANEANVGYRLLPTSPLHRYARPAAGGVLLLGLAGAVGTTLRQRRRLRRLRRTSRRDLLRAFLTSRHGTVGPVGALERVMWSLDNPIPGQEGRPAEVWSGVRGEAVPDLEALLEKAAHIRLDPPLLAVVRRELGKLVHLLDELAPLPTDDPRRVPLQRAARTSLGLVADGVKSLGATLAASCRLDPLPLVKDLLARHAARRPRVVFRLEPGGEAPPACRVDAADLEFALDNLLDNAGRFAAGDRPTVVVRLEADREHVRIRVRDTGPGVSAAQRERLFRQGESSRGGDGGVGLWHSRQALRYYGGDLTLDTGEADGARFTIHLRTEPGWPG